MKIALINPPNQVERFYDSGYKFIHLGLGYIAASIEAGGHQADIFECDLFCMDTKKMIDILIENDYQMIGFTTYYYNMMQVLRIAQKIKKNKSSTFIFTGGIHSSMNYNEVLLNKSIDCCILGEGEESVIELINCIEEKGNLNEIDGIVYRNGNEIQVTGNRACKLDLDGLPFPKRVYYFKNRMASMLVSRGCNGNCSFCGIIRYYTEFTTRNIRTRSVGNVIHEIEYLVSEKEIDYIVFQDENIMTTLLKNKTWISDFCSEIRKKNLKFKFYAYFRVDDILKYSEDLRMLRKIGLDCVFIGIESFVERQLKLYNKRTTPEMNDKVLKQIKDMNMNINIGFILFDPYLKLEEFKTNLDHLISSSFYENCFFGQSPISCLDPLYPMPNTDFYDRLEAMDMLDNTIFHKYRFVDLEINFLFNRLGEWKEKVSRKYEQIDREYQKGYGEQNELVITALGKLRSLIKIDLLFLQELADSDLYSDSTYQSILLKHANVLKCL